MASQAVKSVLSWDQISSGHKISSNIGDGDFNFDLSWFKIASQTYQISPKPEDYVYVLVKALTLDLPNRNLYCFTSEEMLKFDPSYGCMTYQTFIGKPTYIHHEQVIPKSRGIILGASTIQEGPYDYVMLMTAWDTVKDPSLANKIKNPSATTFYSMGCTAFQLVCSICGRIAPGKRNQCDHVKPPIRGTLIRGKLAYEEARKIVFNEQSYVDTPADSRASRMGSDQYTQK